MDDGHSCFDEEAPDWVRKLGLSLDTLGYHLKHPQQPSGRYIRDQHLALGAKVLTKKRVYLDQNYWNYCRDAERGAAQHPLHGELYTLLRSGVACGRIVCPASHLVLDETLKQEDPQSRKLTARIIQELSNGVSLQPPEVLANLEILHFLEASGQAQNTYPPEQLAWTYVANVLGHPSPVLNGASDSLNNAIQKAWFDLMAKLKFTTLVKVFSGYPRISIPPTHYDAQNQQSALHRNNFTSFEEVFLIELAGVLDTYMSELRDCQLYLFEKATGTPPGSVDRRQADEGARMLSKLIFHAFRLNKVDRQLPGFRIMAGIHGAIRFRGQKHRRGDLHDHLHARVALPYCDLFLTERTLGHLLCQKPLGFDQVYGCRIEWTPEGAIEAVRAII